MISPRMIRETHHGRPSKSSSNTRSMTTSKSSDMLEKLAARRDLVKPLHETSSFLITPLGRLVAP